MAFANVTETGAADDVVVLAPPAAVEVVELAELDEPQAASNVAATKPRTAKLLRPPTRGLNTADLLIFISPPLQTLSSPERSNANIDLPTPQETANRLT